MIYGKYKSARDAAWQCLIDNNIQSLPVSVLSIASAENISVIKYSQVDKKRLLESESGSTYFINDKISIIYRDSESPQRCRFTIAHELGHILLGHELIGDRYSRKFNTARTQIESEADIFASRLLAPACVLWGLGLHTADEIARVCNISMSAARIRSERMEILYKRNKFLTSPYERKVFANFRNFIKKYRCDTSV